MRRGLAALAGVLVALIAAGGAGSSPPPRGALSALSGTGACLGAGRGCGALRGPIGLLRFAFSPDGRSLYASGQGGGLAVLARDPRSGRLHQLAGPAGCVRGDGRAGCARLSGFHNPGPIAVSADGRNVYVATLTGIQAFTRNRVTGALHPLSCLDAHRIGCGALRAPTTPSALLLAGGGSLYLSGGQSNAAGDETGGAIAVLARDPATGALSELPGAAGCLDSDGSSGCARAACLHFTSVLALAPGATRVYAGSTDSLDQEASAPGAVATFARGSGEALTELGCHARSEAIGDLAAIPHGSGVLATTLFGDRGTGIAYGSLDLYRPAGSAGVLARSRKLACVAHRPCPLPYDTAPAWLALTPSGSTAYVQMILGGLTVLHLDRHGSATQLPGRAGCLVATGHYMPPPICARSGPEMGEDLIVSPDGRDLYVGTAGFSQSQYYRGGVETFAIAP